MAAFGAKPTFDEAVRSEKCPRAGFSTNTRLEPKLFRCGFANYASVLAVPARCSSNRRVCAGSACLRRTQTINCRTAHVSVSRSVLSAMVRRQRVAAVSGTTAIPTRDSTMRQTASSPRSRIRGFRDRPRRANCHARCSACATSRSPDCTHKAAAPPSCQDDRAESPAPRRRHP